MSQFYASIQGNRGEATRMGSKESGIYGHIRGWNMGGNVSLSHNKQTDSDEIQISLTGGSNRSEHPYCFIRAEEVNGRAHIADVRIDGYCCIPGEFTEEQKTAILAAARLIQAGEKINP